MITSTLCYIERKEAGKGQTLMLYRNKKENDLNEGKWVGVGGKLEAGEAVDECVCREVFEETGLKLTSYELRGVIKFISDKWEDEDMYLYYADGFEGEITPDCNEGELHWVDTDKVIDLPTWEGDYIFLNPFFEGKKDIDITVRYEGEKLVESLYSTEIVNTLKSSKISCKHGFSTRTGGVSEGIYSTLNLGMNRGDIKERVIENWRRFLASCGIDKKEFVCGAQVHGNNVHIATAADLRPAYGPGELIEADGYVTKDKGIALAIFIADCVPVLLEDKVSGVIGAVHCGWRPTVADILKNAVDKMVSLGARPDNICVAIGPAIDKCCFEVGGEVIEAVKQLLGQEKATGFYSKKEIAADEVIKSEDKFMLDLRGVVRERLLQLGLKVENIETVGECTMCNPDKYWSHRYTKGERGSLATVIMM